MKKVEGVSVAKRERMESALWRLERHLKALFPMGRPAGLFGSDVSRYERMEREIRTLQGKLEGER